MWFRVILWIREAGSPRGPVTEEHFIAQADSVFVASQVARNSPQVWERVQGDFRRIAAVRAEEINATVLGEAGR